MLFRSAQIKKHVLALTGLTISIGISYNKFLSKLASDWNKPNGIFEIKSSDMPNLLFPLPILKIHGLGKKTCEKLNRIGIFTVEDLYEYPTEILYNIIGESWAKEVVERIHGIDERTVHEQSDRKSYGKETTFEVDTTDRDEVFDVLEKYLYRIQNKLDDLQLMAKTLTIKIKYFDFEQFTKSFSLPYHTNDLNILREYLDVMYEALELNKPVRLVGLTFSNLEMSEFKQFSLLENSEVYEYSKKPLVHSN